MYTVHKGDEILTKERIFKQYPKVFGEAVSKLVTQCKIQVDKSVPSVQHAPHHAPAVLQSHLMEELNHLKTADIITKVELPTDWVSSLVVVLKKSGKLRICLDPKNLITHSKQKI